jgi:hypothetical protein
MYGFEKLVHHPLGNQACPPSRNGAGNHTPSSPLRYGMLRFWVQLAYGNSSSPGAVCLTGCYPCGNGSGTNIDASISYREAKRWDAPLLTALSYGTTSKRSTGRSVTFRAGKHWANQRLCTAGNQPKGYQVKQSSYKQPEVDRRACLVRAA